jgi:hypothetical protein
LYAWRAQTLDVGRLPPSVQHWLKTIGHARWSLPDAWLGTDGGLERAHSTGFPRRPRIVIGDRLVYYAAGWRVVFAIVEATSEPHVVEHPRWPWRVAVEPLVLVPLLSNAPPVEAIGVAARSMSQQSHIRLGPDHYLRAIEAIASIAAGGSSAWPPPSPSCPFSQGTASPGGGQGRDCA